MSRQARTKTLTLVSWELTIQNRYRFDLDGGRRAVAAMRAM